MSLKDKLKGGFNVVKKKIDEYNEKAPERHELKLKRLKNKLTHAKRKAEVRELENKIDNCNNSHRLKPKKDEDIFELGLGSNKKNDKDLFGGI